MVLSIVAALFDAGGYAFYFFHVYGGSTFPNPASWTIWTFLAALNAFTFWKASNDALVTLQFFVGAGMCMGIFLYALGAGVFTTLDAINGGVLIFCVAACAIWHFTRTRRRYPSHNALYANLVLVGVGAISVYPLIAGIVMHPAIERPHAWILWTCAFVITSTNVYMRLRTMPLRKRMWYMAMPLSGVISHAAVTCLILFFQKH